MESGSCLCDDGIRAWMCGPVVPDAHREFRTDVGDIMRCTGAPSETIDPVTDAFFEHTPDGCRGISATGLAGYDPWEGHAAT